MSSPCMPLDERVGSGDETRNYVFSRSGFQMSASLCYRQRRVRLFELGFVEDFLLKTSTKLLQLCICVCVWRMCVWGGGGIIKLDRCKERWVVSGSEIRKGMRIKMSNMTCQLR